MCVSACVESVLYGGVGGGGGGLPIAKCRVAGSGTDMEEQQDGSSIVKRQQWGG